jgi:hypothetical protein
LKEDTLKKEKSCQQIKPLYQLFFIPSLKDAIGNIGINFQMVIMSSNIGLPFQNVYKCIAIAKGVPFPLKPYLEASKISLARKLLLLYLFLIELNRTS